MYSAILEIKNISKHFGHIKALDNVSLEVNRGEIHALVGENGAGKSTLVKIICGAIKPDVGEILVEGKPVSISNPRDAFGLGIATMYQEFSLLQDMSIWENLFIGRENTREFGFLNIREMKKTAQELCAIVKLKKDVRTPVYFLSAAEKQLLEILKGIAFKAKIIFMDEPSATLTIEEVKYLFEIIRKLKDEGVSIVYISHRLGEIFEIADQVTILKDGRKVTSAPVNQFNNREDIVKLMVGRDIPEDFFGRKSFHAIDHNQSVLSVKNLNSEKVHDVSFNLYKGEILGFAGLVGAGRTEIMRLIFGADKKNSGQIKINNKLANITSPQIAIKNGLGLIPEERKTQGIFLEQSIKDNCSLSILNELSKFSFLNLKREREIVSNSVRQLGVKTDSIKSPVGSLSGGNQQKVVLAKWLANQKLNILILDEPTRGIDVGAKTEIYNILKNLAESGLSLIVVSSELNELLQICDRILVVRNGKIVADLSANEADEEKIMKYATL